MDSGPSMSHRCFWGNDWVERYQFCMSPEHEQRELTPWHFKWVTGAEWRQLLGGLIFCSNICLFTCFYIHRVLSKPRLASNWPSSWLHLCFHLWSDLAMPNYLFALFKKKRKPTHHCKSHKLLINLWVFLEAMGWAPISSVAKSLSSLLEIISCVGNMYFLFNMVEEEEISFTV